MSISRRKGSRGFSIVAAFIAAAILAAVAVAIQSTIPTRTVPASQGAAAEEAAVTEVANKTAASSQSKAPIVPGKDVVTLLFSNQQQANLYYPVCPPNPPDPTSKMKSTAQSLPKYFPNSKLGIPDGRCKPDPKNASRKIPNDGNWQQWTLYCEDKAPNTAASANGKGYTRDITDKDIDDLVPFFSVKAVECKMLPPGTQVGGKTPEQIKALAGQIAKTDDPAARAALTQGLNKADQDALSQALTEQKNDLLNDSQQRTNRNVLIDNQLKDIANGTDDCTNALPTAQANSEAQAASAGEVASAYDCRQKAAALAQEKAINQAQIAANQKQLDNLAAAKVALDPNANPDPNKVPPGTTPPTSPPSGPPNGGGFNNPNVGANNGPQSPFGGACNTRYVCSGNTLYYQSANSMGMYGGNPYGGMPSTGQCMTQPVQQCPYGCQQIAGQTGTQSTLSTIASGLQILSSVMKIFGSGGNNNTSLANNNLPSSCAMTPQQAGQPSPYGTGTNGQPCYQPPQQPDPAQCTSGTWQPTSAQQNGCTSGWQCVPGNGSGGAQPTAQLSCQPQIADAGMPISFSFACGNSSGSTGTGFSTGGALSGNATSTAPNPPAGQNTATYTLTCINQGITSSAQCQVQLSKSGIVLVTNPKTVNTGETSLIGWITSGMKSCTISSPDQQDFTVRNSGNTSVNGAATTSPIIGTTRFRLDCQSLAGNTKSATTSVTTN